jgi:hypothetical protein
MTKPADTPKVEGKLKIPFEPFYRNSLPIGTPCEVVSEDEDRYVVKFPGVVGYSGSFHIKKTYVSII